MQATEPRAGNPYVFIVGCPRSGTTLVQRMINAHPQIAVMPESHWILRLFEKRSHSKPEGLVTPGLLSELLGNPEFARLGIGREELEALPGIGRQVSYADFVGGIFDLYGNARGKSRVGNKTPGFVRRLRTLHALWPQARIVHLIRDGRDVYLSMVHRPLKNPKRGVFDAWKDDPATVGALWWEMNVRLGRQTGSALGPTLYREFRYESLVSHPAEECAALCDFLGLPYCDAMLRFHEGEAKPKAARPVSSGLRDWRSQMPVEDQERFEAAAGELLDELGCARAFAQPSAGMLEAASRARDVLARNPQTRYGAERKQMAGG